MLLPHKGAKAIIGSLRDSLVDEMVYGSASDIDTVAVVLGIDPNYLSVQVRLQIPFFSIEELRDVKALALIRNILRKLRSSLAGFEEFYAEHRRQNGIDLLPISSKVVSREGRPHIEGNDTCFPINISSVDAAVGFEIQEHLHYIHKARADTAVHLGVLLDQRTYPICYCALSRCDRTYQVEALSAALGEQLSTDDVVVMTRAFGFTPLPKNLMSKLFDAVSGAVVKSGVRARYVITALNPFLGFHGSIFLGASYVPFATSPMIYKYSEGGLYRNRRAAGQTTVRQRYATPPILWLARAVGYGRPQTNAQKRLEAITHYYEISEREYLAG
jgi:hypothetical protein